MININFSFTYTEIYFIFVNLVTFIIYGFDKIQALTNNKNISRVSEVKLLLLAVFGGSLGALISMLLFRHKIKKLSFVIKFILIIIVQILGYYFIVL